MTKKRDFSSRKLMKESALIAGVAEETDVSSAILGTDGRGKRSMKGIVE